MWNTCHCVQWSGDREIRNVVFGSDRFRKARGWLEGWANPLKSPQPRVTRGFRLSTQNDDIDRRLDTNDNKMARVIFAAAHYDRALNKRQRAIILYATVMRSATPIPKSIKDRAGVFQPASWGCPTGRGRERSLGLTESNGQLIEWKRPVELIAKKWHLDRKSRSFRRTVQSPRKRSCDWEIWLPKESQV